MRHHGFTRAERTAIWTPPLADDPVVDICAQPIIAPMPCASTAKLSGATPSTKQPVATQCKMVPSSAACARLPRSRRTVRLSLDQVLAEQLSHGDALLVGSSAEIALALPLAAMTMPSVPPRIRCPLSRRPSLLGPRLWPIMVPLLLTFWRVGSSQLIYVDGDKRMRRTLGDTTLGDTNHCV